MSILDQTLLVNMALNVYDRFFVVWEIYKDSKYSRLRRGALQAKTMGIVHHDRVVTGSLHAVIRKDRMETRHD
ncbi:hypothetical protein [Ectopseudomonas composti]|uniref:hypothetical protein n=1 Tax=Ectopseudomonas composti TaxID=658457 RepID=UPI0007746E03|nr:hypothetical protein [Pseudomonas composti]